MLCVLYLFYTAGMTLATAKPARGKGVRSTGAQSATHPCMGLTESSGFCGSARLGSLLRLSCGFHTISVLLSLLEHHHRPASRRAAQGRAQRGSEATNPFATHRDAVAARSSPHFS